MTRLPQGYEARLVMGALYKTVSKMRTRKRVALREGRRYIREIAQTKGERDDLLKCLRVVPLPDPADFGIDADSFIVQFVPTPQQTDAA